MGPVEKVTYPIKEIMIDAVFLNEFLNREWLIPIRVHFLKKFLCTIPGHDTQKFLCVLIYFDQSVEILQAKLIICLFIIQHCQREKHLALFIFVIFFVKRECGILIF